MVRAFTNKFAAALAALLCWSWVAPLAAAERTVRSPAEAVALVQRAAQFVREHGRAQALAEINKPKGPFVDGELYVFAFDVKEDGILLANAAFPLLVGKSILDQVDSNGVPITRNVYKMAKSRQGKGWVDYHWPNAMQGGRVELKSSYVEKVGDLILGCGLPKQWARAPKAAGKP